MKAEGHRNHAVPFCFFARPIFAWAPGARIAAQVCPRDPSSFSPRSRSVSRQARVGRSQPAPAPPSLGDFFKPGLVLQDRNGDGAVDFVDLRLVLPDHPTEVEVTAAADVAARLGFETEAMNLPFPRGAGGQPAVFVGAGSLASAGTTAQALGASGLGPGDGLVAAFRVDGVPAVAVLGGGDAGTTAAAVMLAGRLPYVWDPKGPTADTVAGDVRDFLKGHDLTATAAGVSAVYVQQDGDAAVRVVVDAQMASGAELVKAQVALNQLRVSRDAKRALSYPGVRALRIRLGAPSSRGAIVDLPRAVAPPAPAEPPARRPGNGAKENLDLSTFYSIEGALADSDNNLIPDRVDVAAERARARGARASSISRRDSASNRPA